MISWLLQLQVWGLVQFARSFPVGLESVRFLDGSGSRGSGAGSGVEVLVQVLELVPLPEYKHETASLLGIPIRFFRPTFNRYPTSWT